MPFRRSDTKRRASSMARVRMEAGNAGSATRTTPSTALNTWPQAERYGPRIQSRTSSAGVRNSSGMCTSLGLRAFGRSAISASNGTITVRDQYDTLDRWKKNHFGKCMISTGITGTARHGTWTNRASWMRVNTLQRSAPPAARMATRARVMCGASGESPIAFSA